MLRTVFFAAVSSMSITKTEAPCEANNFAVATPTPLTLSERVPAPVTMATLLASRLMLNLFMSWLLE